LADSEIRDQVVTLCRRRYRMEMIMENKEMAARVGDRYRIPELQKRLPIKFIPDFEKVEEQCYEWSRPLFTAYFGDEKIVDRYFRQRSPLWAAACYPHTKDD
jgi:hypothetical protein